MTLIGSRIPAKHAVVEDRTQSIESSSMILSLIY